MIRVTATVWDTVMISVTATVTATVMIRVTATVRDTATLMKMPYSDPPFAAISIKASVPVKILFANHIEMNQVKVSDIMRIAR